MESLHYDSIIAISAFWVTFVIGFIIIIYRIRRRKCNASAMPPSASPQPEQRRIIHIYYIENVDSNHNTTLSNPEGFLNQALRRIDDQPPSYNDVTQEPEAGPNISSSEPQPDGSESGVNSSTSSSANRENFSSRTHQSDAVVLVEETKIS